VSWRKQQLQVGDARQGEMDNLFVKYMEESLISGKKVAKQDQGRIRIAHDVERGKDCRIVRRVFIHKTPY
jgi:hypothetical protein